MTTLLGGCSSGWEQLESLLATRVQTARVWKCGAFEVSLARPLVMGILNVTPDSFSDGGAHDDPAVAVAFAQEMLASGADIIDVGGESTRPGSDEVAIADELARVIPVVRALAEQGVCVSVDTRHAEVARECVAAGAAIINDVSGFRDPAMVQVAADCDAGLVVMHMLGEPKSMQDDPQYDNVAYEVGTYLREQAHMLEAAGVARARICIDPGPGFGKTAAHNLELLRATPYLASMGYPLMVATSRKRFIGAFTGVEQASERLVGSLATALYAVEHGAAIARVHDVDETVQAFKMLVAITVREGDVAPAELARETKARRAYVALGANEGDRVAQLQAAVDAIDALSGVTVTGVSRVYESKPAYYTDQPVFANAVIACDIRISPRQLLSALQQIETDAGRFRAFANAPRTLDLDVLDIDGEVSDDPVLTMPHPRLLERDFVVTPLLECGARIGEEPVVLATGVKVTTEGAVVGKVTGVLGDLAIPGGR